ncbi:MAG TPA: hypothetical protein VFI68_08550 [Anaerolineales bacterium]|nr:hypothetical protein [Anaerolineales bacterium]
MSNLRQRDFIWIFPLSLGLGAVLSFLQSGNWLIGWLGFSFLFLLCISLLALSTRWANGASTLRQAQGDALFDSTSTSFTPLSAKILPLMVILAFGVRFVGGVVTYLALPDYGYVDDEDQSAGFVYTDAHRRDAQAWDLASSEDPILDAFSKNYAYDQYGGLLAFSAFVYRYLSPDAHRPLMLVLLSAFMAALGLPFLWKAVGQQWGAKVVIAVGWIYALYPESLLLGGSAMREPYLWAFSAFVLWGFVDWGGFDMPLEKRSGLLNHQVLLWLGLGVAGMLLVSPIVALVTLVILAGWVYFTSERGRISWWMISTVVIVFIVGLFLLSSGLNRSGNLGGGAPFRVINNFVREAVKWDVYKLERSSGKVQRLFEQMPEELRLPFVTVYGIFQPVLPATFVEPTMFIWRIIGILRALGWYAMLPALILSFIAAAGQGSEKERKLFIWLSLAVWGWILITALRGGGDQWDNPRYRAILFLWQAILAGNVWVWWRETKNAWVLRVLVMEGVFLLVFGQWYASRYLSLGPQVPFIQMMAIILSLWALIFLWGIYRDRKNHV